MELIKQPNNWTCAAACVCMATGTTLADLYEHCGHDGSQNVAPTIKRPMGKRCFSFQELAGYLLKNNMMFGWGCSSSNGFDPKTATLTVDFEGMPALVDVDSVSPGIIHCVLWDGARIIDPYFPEKKVDISDYNVNSWWPITKIPPDDWGKI